MRMKRRIRTDVCLILCGVLVWFLADARQLRLEAVKALTAGKTLVMIAHRMKTVQEADQILVLDQGRIVQRGRHAELMQQGGIYADFVCSRRSAESWRIAERKSNEVKAEV